MVSLRSDKKHVWWAVVNDPHALNDVELLVLLAVARLPQAYGVTVQGEIEKRGGRRVSITAVYRALERLDARGLVACEMSRPTAERGGRRKRVYRVLPPGVEAMAQARQGLERMWDGVPTPDPGAPDAVGLPRTSDHPAVGLFGDASPTSTRSGPR